MKAVRYSLSLFLALFLLFIYLLSPQRSIVRAIHDCQWGDVGICNDNFFGRDPGDQVCRDRQDYTECRQTGSGEYAYFQCCTPHNEPPPPPPPEPAGCYSDSDCIDGNPCTVDYCLGSGSPGSLCINNPSSQGNVCQRDPNN